MWARLSKFLISRMNKRDGFQRCITNNEHVDLGLQLRLKKTNTRMVMNHWKLLPGLVALLFSISGSVCASDINPDKNRLNVIVLITDDQGWGDLGCYTDGKVKTPNLDRLSKKSFRLNQFYVSPLCSPTRAALISGRYPEAVRVWDTGRHMNLMDAGVYTLSQAFKDNGYATGFFGKWHTGDTHPRLPDDFGFNRYAIVGGGISDVAFSTESGLLKTKGYREEAMFDLALDFIESKRDKSFFTYIATRVPHDCPSPMCPPEYKNMYSHLDEGEGDKEVYGMVSWFDHNVGRLFAKLKELELSEKTLVVYFPDNGPLRDCDDLVTPWERHMVSTLDIRDRFNKGLRAGKVSAYDGGVHVPCFIHWPGISDGGKDIHQLSGHIDIFPTLVDICGLMVSDTHKFDGISVAPVLRGQKDTVDRYFIARNDRLRNPRKFYNTMIRDSKYKLVNGEELYDMDADPAEKNNVKDQYPHIAEKLKTQYSQWWNTMLQENENFTPAFYDLEKPSGKLSRMKMMESNLSVGIEKQELSQFLGKDMEIATPLKFSDGWRVRVNSKRTCDFTVEGIRNDLLTENSFVELIIDGRRYYKALHREDKLTFSNIQIQKGIYYISVRIHNLQSMPIHTLIYWEQGFEYLVYENKHEDIYQN